MAMRLSLPASYSRQPQTIPQIASPVTNSVTSGLVEAITVVNGRVQTINPGMGGGGAFMPTAGVYQGYTLGYSKFGCGITFSGISSSDWQRSYVPPQLTADPTNILNELTLLCLLKNTSTSAQQVGVCYGRTSSVGPGIDIHSGSSTSQMGWQVVNDAIGYQLQTTATNYTVGEPTAFVGRRSKTQNISEIYFNGLLGNSTTCTSLSTCTFVSTCIGGELGSTRGWAGDIYLVALWTRCLTRNEVSSVSANPWQIFDYPSRPLIVNTSAAAAAALPNSLIVKQAINRAANF